jgi:hypothetical protein
MPTPEEVAAVTPDRTYGDRSAAYLDAPQVQPTTAVREGQTPVGREFNARMPLYRTLRQMQVDFDKMDEGAVAEQPPAPVTPAASEELKHGWLASQASALSALGFDPRRMAMADPEGAVPKNLTLGGSFYPRQDQILVTGAGRTSMPHESMHRGMEQLRQAGLMPKTADDYKEESLIRGFMNRHYGDADRQGLAETDPGYKLSMRGDNLAKNPEGSAMLDAIEAAAAQLIAKRNPRGPR